MTPYINDMLVLTPAEFKRGQDVDVAPFVKVVNKSGKASRGGADYLSWAACVYLLKVHFPNLVVCEELNADGHPFFVDPIVGSFVKVFLMDVTTGERTLPMFFPVMTGSMSSSVDEANARQVNDTLQRAKAKLIAIHTGIGFELFLRVDLEELEGIQDEEPKGKVTSAKRKPVEGDDEEETPPRKKRKPVEDDEDEDEEDEDDGINIPRTTQRGTLSSKRRKPADDDDEDDEPVRTKRTSAPATRRRMFQ